MNSVFRLLEKYNNQIRKPQESKYQNIWNRLLIILTVALAIVISCSYVILYIGYDDLFRKLFIGSMLVYALFLIISLVKKTCQKSQNKETHSNDKVITENDWKRLENLKKLLQDEKICFDDTAKIQILIDELMRIKFYPFNNLIELKNIIFNIIQRGLIPIIINFLGAVLISSIIIFLGGDISNLTEKERLQLNLLMFIMMVFGIIFSIRLCYFIIKVLTRDSLHGKYDALIDDLRLLQITKEEKENQSIRCMVFIHEIENLVCIRDNLKDNHSS